MSKIGLLNALKDFTEETLGGLSLPVRVQKNDAKQLYRAPTVFLARIPGGSSADKKAPYVLHQIITSKHHQAEGEYCESSAQVRSIFCVYDKDEQEGGLALLEMMDRWELAVLRDRVIADRYEVDLKTDGGMECLVYPDDTAPYYIGEYVSRWSLPPVKREVTDQWLEEDRFPWRHP